MYIVSESSDSDSESYRGDVDSPLDVEVVSSESDAEISPSSSDGDTSSEESAQSRCDACIFEMNTGHSNYCCECFGDHVAVGTGGDCLIVKNYVTRETVLSEDFSDSVTFLRLHREKGLLAAGDMIGNIKVFRVGDICEASRASVFWRGSADELTALEWHPSGGALLGGTASGEVWMWQVPGARFKMLPTAMGGSVTEMLLLDEMRCLVGFHHNKITMFNLAHYSEKPAVPFQHNKPADSSLVSSLACNTKRTIAAAGCTDGSIFVLSLERESVLMCLNNAPAANADDDDDEYQPSIESILFVSDQFSDDNDKYLVAASLDSNIYVYSLATYSIHSTVTLGHGIVKLIACPWKLDASSSSSSRAYWMLAVVLDGSVALVDAHRALIGPRKVCNSDHILDVCLLPGQSGKIFTCSDDGTCKLFDMLAPNTIRPADAESAETEKTADTPEQ